MGSARAATGPVVVDQGGRTHAEGTQLVNYNPIGSGGGIQAISTRQVLLFAPLPKPVLVVGERTLKKIHS